MEFIFPLCFFLLSLTTTNAQNNLIPKLSPNPNSPLPHIKQIPNSNSNSNSNSKLPHTKPNPNSNPNSNSKTPPPTKPPPPPKPRTSATSPYQFANHFCLSRRLDVKTTFCLQVLRSGPASTKARDNQALLGIAADAAIQFSRESIALMKKMSAGKKTKPDLKPAIEECVSAYEGYLKQFQTLEQEARIEAQLASYDSELAKLEINRCVKALRKVRNADIEAQNKVALDYANLSQNIADSIG